MTEVAAAAAAVDVTSEDLVEGEVVVVDETSDMIEVPVSAAATAVPLSEPLTSGPPVAPCAKTGTAVAEATLASLNLLLSHRHRLTDRKVNLNRSHAPHRLQKLRPLRKRSGLNARPANLLLTTSQTCLLWPCLQCVRKGLNLGSWEGKVSCVSTFIR